MITLGKRGDLHARRLALAELRSQDVVHQLFADVAPRFADRAGGYTRIVKLGPRYGDAAEMVYLELVDYEPAGAAPASPTASASPLAMLLLCGILLAVFVIPWPWGIFAILGGALLDIGESAAFLRWSRRRKSPVGPEALVGQTAVVMNPTQVRLAGELWAARSDDPL